MSSPEVVAKPGASSSVTKAESASAKEESPPPAKPTLDQGTRSRTRESRDVWLGAEKKRDRHASALLPRAAQPPLRQDSYSRDEDRRIPISCSPSTRPPQEHAGPAKIRRPPAPPARKKTAATKSRCHRYWPQPGRQCHGGTKQLSDPDQSSSHK